MRGRPRSTQGCASSPVSRTTRRPGSDRLDGVLTPVGRHFVRNHFALPEHPGTLRSTARFSIR